MTRLNAKLASFVSVLAFAGSAFAVAAPMPSKAQEAQVTKQIQRNVQRTVWYKGLVKTGQKPKLTVSYSQAWGPIRPVGPDFTVASATVYAGKKLFSSDQLPQKQRKFKVVERASGKFAPTGDKWHQINNPTATQEEIDAIVASASAYSSWGKLVP